MPTMTPAELGLPTQIPLPRRRDWKVGFVGFGGIANAHADAADSAKAWTVVAAADPMPAARERAQKRFSGIRTFEHHQQLIDDPEVEVVVVLTQPTLREPVIAAAAKAGKHILVEKPFANTLEEATRMADLADAAGIRLAVSQNYRFNGPAFLARAMVDKGLIGTPYLVSIEIVGTQDVDLKEHPFYAKCDNFLTVQWNNHLADLLRYFTSRDPVRLSTTTRRMAGQHFVSDNLLLSAVDLGEGVTGHILHSELSRGPLNHTRCRIDGDAGTIVLGLWDQHLLVAAASLGKEPVTVDVASAGLVHSMAGTLGDLLIAVENKTEPTISARRNLPTIRHALADDRSARAGGAWQSV